MRLLPIFLLLVTAVFSARPHDPWVSQVSIKERTRQLYVALHSDLWIMYDLPYCVFYLAWKGGADGGTLTNADYIKSDFKATPHTSTQFNPGGTTYFKQDNIDQYYPSGAVAKEIPNYYSSWSNYPTNYRAWKVKNGTQAVEVKLKYKGYFTKVNGQQAFKLKFSLVLPDNREIEITEEPEYVSGTGVGLSRKITIAGIPSGYSVMLHTKGGTGTWTATGVGSITGDDMTQTSDGVTTLSATW
ncbi:MAG: hypothetical protein HQK83_11345 [Fibrobacteria bacterium]|nr:hypothetical protein [Fibrobacteria bacterium]